MITALDSAHAEYEKSSHVRRITHVISFRSQTRDDLVFVSLLVCRLTACFATLSILIAAFFRVFYPDAGTIQPFVLQTILQNNNFTIFLNIRAVN